jgi:hypothetical protein
VEEGGIKKFSLFIYLHFKVFFEEIIVDSNILNIDLSENIESEHNDDKHHDNNTCLDNPYLIQSLVVGNQKNNKHEIKKENQKREPATTCTDNKVKDEKTKEAHERNYTLPSKNNVNKPPSSSPSPPCLAELNNTPIVSLKKENNLQKDDPKLCENLSFNTLSIDSTSFFNKSDFIISPSISLPVLDHIALLNIPNPCENIVLEVIIDTPPKTKDPVTKLLMWMISDTCPQLIQCLWVVHVPAGLVQTTVWTLGVGCIREENRYRGFQSPLHA